MKILIATFGTRGDVQPYVALGIGLQRAGHAVTLCTSARFEAAVVGNGLVYAHLSDDLLKLLESAEGREALEGLGSVLSGVKTAFKLIRRTGPMQRSLLWDGWTAAVESHPDLIVYNSKMGGAVHYAEKLGALAVLAVPFPQFVPTAEFPTIGFPRLKLGGWYNRLTYRIVMNIAAHIGRRYLREWRSLNNLPKQPRCMDLLHTSNGMPVPVLHAISRHVLPPPHDWPDSAVSTGYWFLNRPGGWAPPAELQRFLQSGQPPVYVGFGSMATRDPRHLTQVVVQALQELGVRGVLATGWGGLTTERLPETLFPLDQVAHDWLFPQMAAVVHHGGAGTTAAGLRAGCPTVICPFFGDQSFWGWRVHDLGVGSAPIPQRKVTATRLANALTEVLTNPVIRQKADALSEKIRQEDGVAEAVVIIDQIVKRADPPRRKGEGG